VPSLAALEEEGAEGRLWLRSLVRLRWVAIVAQLVTLGFASRMLRSPIVALPLVGVTAVLLLGNLVAQRTLRRGEGVRAGRLFAELALDVGVLTAYFCLAGGPENPFTALYFIHVALGAIVLPARAATGLAAFTLGCYAFTNVFSLPLELGHHWVSERRLVQAGHFVAFVLTVVTVTTLVSALAQARRERERMLQAARERSAATDRLRALGTLAAGAAHELNTPLSTVGLRLRRVARRYSDADTVADVDAMRGQLERCAQIVERLLVGAGDPSASDIDRYTALELVAETTRWWSVGSGLEVRVLDHAERSCIEVPRVAFTQALVNLLENAREAQLDTAPALPIEVVVELVDKIVTVKVIDHGCGLPKEPHRVGDPFFTTKASGTGLGVFVARAVADGTGGGLRYATADGRTEAIWWFPAVEC